MVKKKLEEWNAAMDVCQLESAKDLNTSFTYNHNETLLVPLPATSTCLPAEQDVEREQERQL